MALHSKIRRDLGPCHGPIGVMCVQIPVLIIPKGRQIVRWINHWMALGHVLRADKPLTQASLARLGPLTLATIGSCLVGGNVKPAGHMQGARSLQSLCKGQSYSLDVARYSGLNCSYGSRPTRASESQTSALRVRAGRHPFSRTWAGETGCTHPVRRRRQYHNLGMARQCFPTGRVFLLTLWDGLTSILAEERFDLLARCAIQ